MAHGDDHVGAGRRAAPRAASFRRGFRELSPLVLVVALLLAGLSLVGFEALVRSGVFVAVSEGRFLRIAHDDYAHVTYRVAELRQDPPDGPTVYLFGGSGAMESFVSEGSLTADVSRAAGTEVGVVSLAAHGQSFAQTIAIVDNLPDGDALLAVGLAPMRFTVAPASDAGLLLGRTMPLVSPYLREALAAQGVDAPAVTSVLPGAFDYLSAYLRSRPQDGLGWLEDIGYEPHYWDGQPVNSVTAKTSEAEDRIAIDGPLYARHGAYNLGMLEELLRLAQERGFAVALFEQPLNAHVADPTWGGVLPDYRRRVRALARRYGVAYLDVQQRVALADEDFGDVYHLVARGRLKWQPVLARQLAEALALEGIAGEAEPSSALAGAGLAAAASGR
jgi:hypothetical protein